MIRSFQDTAITSYPVEFPLPNRADYRVSMQYTESATPMQDGHSKRRLMTPFKLWSCDMTFMMEQPQFVEWHKWVREIGFHWFNMPCQDERVVATAEPFVDYQAFRFTTGVQWSLADWGWVSVSISGEHPLRAVPR